MRDHPALTRSEKRVRELEAAILFVLSVWDSAQAFSDDFSESIEDHIPDLRSLVKKGSSNE